MASINSNRNISFLTEQQPLDNAKAARLGRTTRREVRAARITVVSFFSEESRLLVHWKSKSRWKDNDKDSDSNPTVHYYCQGTY